MTIAVILLLRCGVADTRLEHISLSDAKLIILHSIEKRYPPFGKD